jgi:hypothetical protein
MVSLKTRALNPVLETKKLTAPFLLSLNDLMYEFDTSGKVKCRGPWNPRNWFPRKLICFRGHLYSVDSLVRHVYEAGVVQSILLPSSIQFIARDCFGSLYRKSISCKFLELVAFKRGSQLIDREESAFRNCYALKGLYLPASVERLFSRCFFRCTAF